MRVRARTFGALVVALAVLAMPAGSYAGDRPGAVPHHLGWAWYGFATSGQLADAWSTKRFRALGIQEGAHPLVGPDSSAFYGYKAAVGLGVTALGSWVDGEGQRRRSRALRIVGRGLPVLTGGLGFAAAIHNERAISRARSGRR